MHSLHQVTWAADHVLNISMNRPKVLNAQNPQMWEETKGVFDAASTDPDCRCVLLTGNGRLFTAGIDLQQSFVSDDVQTGESGGSKAPAAAPEDAERPDVARRALAQLRGIGATQALFNAIEECRVPVVAAIHRACLGAGVDMVCAADIRFCTADSTFAIKEVMLGLAADVGTLQRMPKVMGSESLLRELAFTGRCVVLQLSPPSPGLHFTQLCTLTIDPQRLYRRRGERAWLRLASLLFSRGDVPASPRDGATDRHKLSHCSDRYGRLHTACPSRCGVVVCACCSHD